MTAATVDAHDLAAITKIVETSLLTEGTSLESIEPAYARFKGDDGNLVAYNTLLRTKKGLVERTVSVRSGPIDRLVSQEERFHDLRASNWTAPLKPCVLLPDQGLLVIAFPLDRALSDLRRVLDTKWVRRTLASTDILGGQLSRMSRSRSTLTLLSYRPERRAVVRLDARFLGAIEGCSLLFRLHADSAFAEASERTLTALSGAGLPVPDHLGSPLPHLAVESHCSGVPLTGQALCGADIGRQVGRLLARVHSSPVPEGTDYHMDADLMHAGLTCVANLSEVHTEFGARALRVAAGIPSVCPSPGTPALLHGDVHPGQFLVEKDRVSLIDWDRSHAGHPASDLATLRARLVLEAGAEGLEAFGEVLSAYGEVTEAPAPEALRWHEARALLRLVDTPFRRIAADWATQTRRIIHRLEEIA